MATVKQNTQPKMMRVAPTVTDPSMRTRRGPAERLLSDELGSRNSRKQQVYDADDVDDVDDAKEHIFSGSVQTKEEKEASGQQDAPYQYGTMLIVVFALIVIALVALIVWMLMKQSNNKKDEEELRRVIQPQPHPRNNMPNMPNMPNMNTVRHQQQTPQAYDEHMRNMAQIQQQQQQLQNNMAQMNEQLSNKTFAEVIAENEAAKNQQNALANDKNDSKYNVNNPHPGILRPGQPSKSDVDDILEQTDAILNKPKVRFTTSDDTDVPKDKKRRSRRSTKSSKSNNSELSTSDMSDIDKALLDKVSSNTNDSESEIELDD
jgi:cell division protein FtsN